MKKVLLLIGLVAVLIAAGWSYQSLNAMRVNARTAKFNEDVDNLFYALQQYKEKVGAWPVGSNGEIAKALMGNNSKNLMILVGRKQDLNSKGEFIDPWGTPLRIYFAGEGIMVRSAGPNKRFDDSTVLNGDDYYRSN
ncbi:MAG TPA: hypothetical protein VG754_12830 [Verrucomicrobiae bacterium]|jgi:hypothetical protein|nr:hypothetical protein [Verrucomicrobiae bacterium]